MNQIYLGIVLLVITAFLAESEAGGTSNGIGVVVGRRKRSLADAQGRPNDCQVEVDVLDRENAAVDFVICVKPGYICTSRKVLACSSGGNECSNVLKKKEYEEAFQKMFPDAYAQVCLEANGEQCLYTDIAYHTCPEAKIMSANEICITLSNGKEECSEIPQEFVAELMLQSAKESVARMNKVLPPYIPQE